MPICTAGKVRLYRVDVICVDFALLYFNSPLVCPIVDLTDGDLEFH